MVEKTEELRVMDKGDTRRDVSKVRDVDGDMKQGKEAVMVWKNHFEKLLSKQNNSLLNEDLAMQEMMWALGNFKRKAAPGKGGLTVEMISKEVLLQVWYELFKLCWKEGMIPSIWKQSVVIPVPKMKSRGPCNTDDIWGISLVLVPYKAMCMLVKERLALVVEERTLVAEEQGDFRKLKGEDVGARL